MSLPTIPATPNIKISRYQDIKSKKILSSNLEIGQRLNKALRVVDIGVGVAVAAIDLSMVGERFEGGINLRTFTQL